MNTHPSPLKIKIASPCTASWAGMKGDHRARFCEKCSKHVYNLSGMTATEAAALIQAREGRLCVRVFQRADGTVLHGKDCPVGIARYRQRMRAFWGASVSAVVLIFAHVRAFAASPDEQTRSRNEAAVQAAWGSFQTRFADGFDPKGPTMGDLIPIHMPTPPPSPSPIPQQPAK